MTPLHAVRAWRDELAQYDPAEDVPELSPQGARAAWRASLDALSDEALTRATDLQGEPFQQGTLVMARTVFTASLEWCAVLLARGTKVVVKHPRGIPGVLPRVARAAQTRGLPLFHTDARPVPPETDIVVAMGSDATIADLRETLAPEVRFLGFGHRVGAAFVQDLGSFEGVARDAALYDGRGCMSPAAVFTDLPAQEALQAMATAFEAISRQLPAVSPSPAEAATMRARRALAKATGDVREGDGWSVHLLPPDRYVAGSLPRSVALHCVDSTDQVRAILAAHEAHLSTLGTDNESLAARWRLPTTRVCRPGHMQCPPLHRLHDGVDWLRETLRAPSQV